MAHFLPVKFRGKIFLFIAFLLSNLIALSVHAQYTLNGSATQNNCHCYTLTQPINNQQGSVWNNNRISLTQSFDFKFNVFLGCADALGADGIVFVLQNQSTSIGGNGSGMGYGGITPGVGVTLDTYQNISPDNDPVYDHIAIQLNGNMNHSNLATNIAGPIPISSTSNNVEDCQWHVLHVTWDAPTHTLTAYFDGVFRLSVVNDFTNTVFSGNPSVFWGFTGATGGSNNLQQFCTTLTPNFHLQPNQSHCLGQTFNFYDSTTSFGPVVKRYWNFGDGSPIDSVNLNPSHIYLTGGDFTVTLTVTSIDGCSEVTTQTVHVGWIPVAKFGSYNACQDSVINFSDSSSVQGGSINSWYWGLGGGTTSILPNPSATYTVVGPEPISLVVTSNDGCVSDTVRDTIQIYPRAIANFGFNDSICTGGTVQFHDSSSVLTGSITGWDWDLFDGQTSIIPNPSGTYLTPGTKVITLIARSDKGCRSAPVTRQLTVLKPVANFTHNTICQSSSTTLTDSSYSVDGSLINNWWWDLGNSQYSTARNPPTVYLTAGTVTIRLAVRSVLGCLSDTLVRTITINPKPIANFGYSSPLCSGIPVQFTDSSAGTNTYNWIFDNGTSTQRNPVQSFIAGNHTTKLIILSNPGCISDTVSKVFFINPKPLIGIDFANSCKNTPVLFTGVDSIGNTVSQWIWNFGDGSVGTGGVINHTYPVTGNYTIKLVGVAQSGCVSDQIQKVINIYGTNASAGNDIIAASLQPVQLNAVGGVSYQWSPAYGLSDPNIPNPIAILTADQTYYLKAFTPQGCATFDTINIKIYKGPDIYVPNAFSPNNDGYNDVFHAFPIGIVTFNYMKVFNRLGQEIYNSSDYTKGWDGKYKGEYQPVGIYLWMASGIDFKGNLIVRKGTVMLLR